MSKKVVGLYWYCGFAKRICFMPMEHKVPRTRKLAEYFLAEVCRQVGERVEDTTAGLAIMVQTQLSWDMMEEHTLSDGMKYLTGFMRKECVRRSSSKVGIVDRVNNLGAMAWDIAPKLL